MNDKSNLYFSSSQNHLSCTNKIRIMFVRVFSRLPKNTWISSWTCWTRTKCHHSLGIYIDIFVCVFFLFFRVCLSLCVCVMVALAWFNNIFHTYTCVCVCGGYLLIRVVRCGNQFWWSTTSSHIHLMGRGGDDDGKRRRCRRGQNAFGLSLVAERSNVENHIHTLDYIIICHVKIE